MEAIINNRYKILEKMKVKGTSTIYHGLDLKEKREVAIRVIDLKNTKEKEINKI